MLKTYSKMKTKMNNITRACKMNTNELNFENDILHLVFYPY